MDTAQMRSRFLEIQQLTSDHAQWLSNPIGIDLWVDGLNVYTNIELAEFEETLDLFLEEYGASSSYIETLERLQTFCRREGMKSEYELYKAFSVGMTWLSLDLKQKNSFFNLPIEITDHSLWLLLSPTYLTLFAHGYNAGLTLHFEYRDEEAAVFRPEHGRVYENCKPSQRHSNNLKAVNFSHELAHLLLFYDLYPRVLSENEAEDISSFVHVEAVCCYINDRLLVEGMEINQDLYAYENGFASLLPWTLDPGYDCIRINKGEIAGLTGRSLSLYTTWMMQQGTGDRSIADNPVKAKILQNFAVSEAEQELIRGTHYQTYAEGMKIHSKWGIAAAKRNRLPGYRRTVELLPPDPYCLAKMAESFDPDAWPTPASILSCERLPELDAALRERNLERWKQRELFFRLAEAIGYLELVLPEGDDGVAEELHDTARLAAKNIISLETNDTAACARSGLQERVFVSLARLPESEAKQNLLDLFGNPYSYVLEPK
ncbi:hypothetical protein EV586_105109 [Tumebacillus sp. BK434]|uniref:hypothetical protein n=1 Tax=Tumebacillus sp. BK434 TaxID=2512169 RepID=UPI0010445366|nr:hypothetical protein [Tumebacillus sp. BK434]TCP53765.1 hypothetical protein EV586_105109 [Tumebacillus sp. BK434]